MNYGDKRDLPTACVFQVARRDQSADKPSLSLSLSPRIPLNYESFRNEATFDWTRRPVLSVDSLFPRCVAIIVSLVLKRVQA